MGVNRRMRKFLHLFLILIVCVFVQACSANDAVEVKVEAWKVKLKEFQPIGKSKEELFKWRRKMAC